MRNSEYETRERAFMDILNDPDKRAIYEKSSECRYKPGDVLVLRREAAGFGKRPVAIIEDYQMTGFDGAGEYYVTMMRDVPESETRIFEDITDIQSLNDGLVRITRPGERHFKWNIEYYYDPVPTGVEAVDAHNLYYVDLSPESFHSGQ